MTEIRRVSYECDGCKKKTNNIYRDSFIEVRGQLTKHVQYNVEGSEYDCQTIGGRDEVRHFCSWKCLMGCSEEDSKTHLEDSEYKKLISE